MRKIPDESHTLIEPEHALRVYLDALLSEIILVADVDVEITNIGLNDPGLENTLQRATEGATESSSSEQYSPTETPNKQISTVIPDWAEVPFQCLSFQVAGITLAAPLEKLNGIVEFDEEITELPGYASWVIGLLPNRGQNVQVVDIAEIIMPDEGMFVPQPTAERMKFIILLEDGKFGLATDSISQVLSLNSEDVCWRGEQSKRPWLAGTVVEKMCALLEVDLLCSQLQAGLKGV